MGEPINIVAMQLYKILHSLGLSQNKVDFTGVPYFWKIATDKKIPHCFYAPLKGKCEE